MENFKLWIKRKIKNFLDIEMLEDNFEDYQEIHHMETEGDRKYVSIFEKDIREEIDALHEKIDVLHTTLENVVSIATDVEPQEKSGSWAVVCVEGRVNRVQFYNLSHSDGQEVFRFLKGFEAGHHCIDSPWKYFKEGLFKF